MKNKHYTLIFVYNAKSGAFNSVFDAIHKKVSPDTYKCNLCKITYGMATMNKDWKKFIENLKISVEFLHKDEFKKKFDYKNAKFPALFLKNDNKLKQLISAAEMNKSKSIDELIKLVEDKVTSIK